MPQGFEPWFASASAAASCAQSAAKWDVLAGTLLAPSCIPLDLLDVPNGLGVDGTGVAFVVAKTDIPFVERLVRPDGGGGADVGRSRVFPLAAFIVLWRSDAASCMTYVNNLTILQNIEDVLSFPEM